MMTKKTVLTACACGLVLSYGGVASAGMVSFTAADVKAVMAANGAPLHDAANQWGLWAIRAMPIVGGSGSYTIGSGSTTQTGWGVSAPNGAFGNSPYTATNSVWFWDASGAEVAGHAANPLYMIMDVSDSNWYSSAFNQNGSWVADWAPGPDGTQGTGDDLGTFYASGYDSGAGGTNVITAASDVSTFSFDFTLGSGATWDGSWQFVVDGSKYTLGTPSSPGGWVENFFGGYGSGGGLGGNMGAGYPVPAPGAAILAMIGMGVATRLRRRFGRA